MQELIDLSIPTLMASCKGNVKALPSFMVHDNTAWMTQGVQLDNKNLIANMRISNTSQNTQRPLSGPHIE